ncbi:hypothetical protein [Asticcacaulis sp. AC402]|uniref:hypothetical protein n=1 Tax=Asticcacaulis sp. AC402 TaxID=1282361 RepID=UPI0003C3AEFE|nr:hypothetical protein [Asticcacaulis sp. AC402]ESQ75559.1 hypothetical protein ABAC402_08515 [Asticcacaulis sp. AC402]
MRKILIVTAALLMCASLSGCITRGCDNKPVKTCDSQKAPMGYETAVQSLKALIS